MTQGQNVPPDGADDALDEGASETQPGAVIDLHTADIHEYAARNGLKVNEPMRPDLAPGESVTVEPDRWCDKCQQARAKRRCTLCGGITIARVVLEQMEPDEDDEQAYVDEERQARIEAARERVLERQQGGRVNRSPGRVLRNQPELEHEEQFEVEQGYAGRSIAELEQPQHFAAVGGAPRAQRPQAQTRMVAAPAPVERRFRQQQTPPAVRGRAQRVPMAQSFNRGARMEQDEYGQVVHMARRRGQSRGQAPMSAGQQLTMQWVNGQIDVGLWVAMQGSCIQALGCSTADEIELASELADEAYIQLMSRRQGG